MLASALPSGSRQGGSTRLRVSESRASSSLEGYAERKQARPKVKAASKGGPRDWHTIDSHQKCPIPCISFDLPLLGYFSLTYHSHQRHLPCGGASDALFARNEWRVALTTSMCQEVDAVKKQHRKRALYLYPPLY